MSTTIRPEISEKNRYWIDRHRYYELKHFCMQYPLWKKAYKDLQTKALRSSSMTQPVKSNTITDLTSDYAEQMAFYSDRMNMVECAAQDTDIVLWRCILRAVTEGLSYEILKTDLRIPCCKDVYYELYRKFFWILSNKRK